MRAIGAVLLLGSIVLGSVALVGRADAQTCKQQAKAAFKDCQAQCKSDFVDARFTCRNIQPACGEACLAGRQACFDKIDQILETGVVDHRCSTSGSACNSDTDCPSGETCVTDTLANCSTGTDACNAAFTATATGDPGSGGCGATCGPHGQVCDCSAAADVNACNDCIDNAQVTRFLCRDTCRDSFRVNAVVVSDRTACRASFKACVQACPPAS